MYSEILQDKRTIESVERGVGDESTFFSINSTTNVYKVDKIEVYAEPGRYCELPWFHIFRDDKIICRMSATECTIKYAEETDG